MMVARFVGFLCLFLSVISFAEDYEYRLATGDTISIAVYQEADLSFTVKIDESGVFDYPYLETITLAGKTTSEIEKELTQGLITRVLVNPEISVAIVEYRSFSIGGEVAKPGSYPYTPGLTVKRAINIAGGFTDWASQTRFELERQDKATESDKYTLNSPIYPGDILTISPRRF